MLTKEKILAKISAVEDPEIKVSIVDLGLVYDVVFADDHTVNISMTLTAPGCPYGPRLVEAAKNAVLELDGIEKVNVELVWNPPWNPNEMASEYAKDVLGIW
jgi:metal-sulfur cluster biosynthetic enzyme